MLLEIRRAVAKHRIRSRVRLVEGVVGKAFHIRKQLGGNRRIHAALHGTGDKRLPLCQQHGGFLFRHGAPHNVRVPEGVARNLAEDLHDLLLIDHAAVGRAQNRLQQRRCVGHLFRVVAAFDKGGNRIHRSRAVKRDGGNDIVNALRHQIHQHLPHPARLQLKHAGGLARRNQPVGRGIVLRNRFQVKRRLALANLLLGVVQDGQVAQGKKIEFQQPQLCHGVHVILRHDCAVRQRQRHVFRNRLVGNDDTGGVNRHVARHSLQRHGGVDQPFHACRAFIQPFQFRQLQRHRKRDIRLLRHGARHLVNVAVRHPERPPDVAHGCSGGKRAEGDDLRHVVLPVAPPDVGNHLVPAVVAEININIRHADALGVQEPLKEQVKPQRVDVGNAQRIGNQAARARPSPGTDRNILRPRVVHVVLHDQEVVGVAHLQNDRQLVFHALAVCRFRMLRKGDVPLLHALRKARLCLLAQVIRSGFARRAGKFRQIRGGKIEADLAAPGDAAGVCQRLGIRLESHGHLVRILEVELVGCEGGGAPHIDRCVGLDAHQNRLRVCVLAAQVVAVVGGNQRQPAVLCKVDQHGQHGPLLCQPVVLNFDIEMLGTEGFRIPFRSLLCALIVPFCQLLRNLSTQACRQRNQPAMVAAQQLLVDARFVIKALGKGARHHLAQIAVSLVALAEQDQVVGVAVRADGLLKPRVVRHVDLAPDDRLDPCVPARLPECDRAVHHAMVGQRHRLLSAFLHPLRNVRYPARAVQQAIFAMQVQMHESVHVYSFLGWKALGGKTLGRCPKPCPGGFLKEAPWEPPRTFNKGDFGVIIGWGGFCVAICVLQAGRPHPALTRHLPPRRGRLFNGCANITVLLLRLYNFLFLDLYP